MSNFPPKTAMMGVYWCCWVPGRAQAHPSLVITAPITSLGALNPFANAPSEKLDVLEKLDAVHWFFKGKNKHKPRQALDPAMLREIQTGVREANVIRKHMRRFKKVQKNMRNEMYKK